MIFGHRGELRPPSISLSKVNKTPVKRLYMGLISSTWTLYTFICARKKVQQSLYSAKHHCSILYGCLDNLLLNLSLEKLQMKIKNWSYWNLNTHIQSYNHQRSHWGNQKEKKINRLWQGCTSLGKVGMLKTLTLALYLINNRSKTPSPE